MIPTRRRLQYASGFLELGMTREAGKELSAIVYDDRDAPETLVVKIDWHMQTKSWKSVRHVARKLAREEPANEKGWISWAYALRELGEIEQAKKVLLEALPLHGKTCDVLHYNLACYDCLLGNLPQAKRHLSVAIKRDKQWKAAALEDMDLNALWSEINLPET